MTSEAFFAVLLAAALHAVWNSVLKSSPTLEAVVGQTVLSSIIGLVGVCFIGLIPLNSLVFLLVSSPFHAAARYYSIKAYEQGDLSQVYPLFRGMIPLVVAVLSYSLLGERISLVGVLSLLLISGSVSLLSLEGKGSQRNLGRQVLAYIFLTSISAAAYTVINGVGVRISLNPLAFAFWLFLIEGIVSTIVLGRAISNRGEKFDLAIGYKGILAGLIQLASFGLVVYAMSIAQISLVAGLRETSIVFALILSKFVLREHLTSLRVTLSLVIVFGAVLLKIS